MIKMIIRRISVNFTFRMRAHEWDGFPDRTRLRLILNRQGIILKYAAWLHDLSVFCNLG